MFLGSVQSLNDRQDSLLTMMVRVHEAVKCRKSTDDSQLPFLSTQEELETLKEKLADQEERKKLVSIFSIVLFTVCLKKDKLLSALQNNTISTTNFSLIGLILLF